MSEKRVIKPEVLGGFRDFLPKEALARQEMFEKIGRICESFGFVPLDTPGMERLEVLTGGDEKFNKSIFTARIKKGEEDKGVSEKEWEQDYALRFDLTVPLARVVAANPDLIKPFKRYQVGKVWRGERQQAGRFREFYQFDFDIIGAKSTLADVEIINLMYSIMKSLGIDGFIIRFNTRKILNGLAEKVGCLARANEMFRVMDKQDKIGREGVLEELKRQPDNEFDESALSFSETQLEAVKLFLGINGSNSEEIISKLKEFFGDSSTAASYGIKELEFIADSLRRIGLPENNWQLDLSVARGLDYYTGPVFETFLTDLPALGSVLSGGRFDGLTNRFMPGSNIAGVGASVGVDRLLVGMKTLGLVEEKDSVTQVLVTVFDESDESLISASLEFADLLRKSGLSTEIYLGEDSSLRVQISYAAKNQFRL
jgi:histidyl-tRNA synthetase